MIERIRDDIACKSSPCVSPSFRTNLRPKRLRRLRLRENKDVQLQFFLLMQSFIISRRNIPGLLIVYTGAATCRAAQGEIQKKPRGGSRGVMTRSFSGRLVQEEEVSSRARLLVRRLRVNSILPAAACRAADSILSERNLTRMKTNSFFRMIALLAAFALAVPAFAKPVSKTISLNQAAKVGKAELQAGEYRLLIDGNKVTVQRGNKVVAESEGRWEDRSAKSSYDSLLIGENGQIKEVRFNGQARVFVFSE
jgi:hypothetical protein